MIISGKDSVSKASAGTAEHFAEVLQEFDKICRETSESKITELADLKTKCERIFNYEFLTFKDFMEIYYILSFAAGANRSKGMVSELNGQLAELLMSLQGTGPDEMIGPKVTARMKETAEKLLKGKIK